MKGKQMHAVFYMSEAGLIRGLQEHTIYLFDSEAEAVNFQFEKLLKMGLIPKESTKAVDVADRKDAVSVAQFGFDGLEFFHCYPVIRVHDATAAQTQRNGGD